MDSGQEPRVAVMQVCHCGGMHQRPRWLQMIAPWAQAHDDAGGSIGKNTHLHAAHRQSCPSHTAACQPSACMCTHTYTHTHTHTRNVLAQKSSHACAPTHPHVHRGHACSPAYSALLGLSRELRRYGRRGLLVLPSLRGARTSSPLL